MRRKGISVIVTYILVLALVMTAVGVAYIWGSKELRKMQDQQQLQLSEGFMKNVDTAVSEIIKEGQYSARTYDVDMNIGELYSKGLYIMPSPTPSPTGTGGNSIPFPTIPPPPVTDYANFHTIAFRQSVLSNIVSSAGAPARNGNIVKRVAGAGQAYLYEIFESYVGITVENEMVYNPTNGANELRVYVTVHITNFNVPIGQRKSNIRLRLQNAGYQNWELVDPTSFYLRIDVKNSQSDGDGEMYEVGLKTGNNQIVEVRYTPSSATITPYAIKSIVLPMDPTLSTSCNRSTSDCWFFRFLVTTIDVNMGGFC